MRRMITIVFGLSLVAAACGDDGAATTTGGTQPTATVSSQPAPASSSTSAAASSTSTSEAAPVGEPLPGDAVAAPDFDLTLGEGGTFTLSAVETPVYLVFWAEW